VCTCTRHSNTAAITPPGFLLSFHLFKWERGIVERYVIKGADNSMVNFNRERKRILFVEDNEDCWDIVAITLGECVVVCARDFNEGVRLARLGYFDLYLLDNKLPDGTGIELSRAIRKFDPYTPILFYSAAAYTCDIQKASHAGAQAYLVKPVIPDELKRTVTNKPKKALHFQ
jgi:CheY-like chemotaxis protein